MVDRKYERFRMAEAKSFNLAEAWEQAAHFAWSDHAALTLTRRNQPTAARSA
jgi:hypothetical protein